MKETDNMKVEERYFEFKRITGNLNVLFIE